MRVMRVITASFAAADPWMSYIIILSWSAGAAIERRNYAHDSMRLYTHRPSPVPNAFGIRLSPSRGRAYMHIFSPTKWSEIGDQVAGPSRGDDDGVSLKYYNVRTRDPIWKKETTTDATTGKTSTARSCSSRLFERSNPWGDNNNKKCKVYACARRLYAVKIKTTVYF